jgi:two-component system KDP operon response regulator KdpE
MSHLLIVDDDVNTSAALAALLRARGHDVECAGNVGEALRQLQTAQPELLLLDLGLPRVDGLDLLKALAEEPQYSDLPVVVYSGPTDVRVVKTALRRGAGDYIVKGGPWEQTCRRIESRLSRTFDA